MNNKKLIRQSNELTEACYKITAPEKKLLMLACWHISRQEKDKPEKKVVINTHEYLNQWGGDLESARKEIKRSIDKLYDREILFPKENAAYRWLQARPINIGDGTIKIIFSDHVFAHFKEKIDGGNFTKLYLSDLSKLKTFYAMRFYELFRRHPRGWLTITLVDLCLMFDAPESYLGNFDLINRRIIKKALLELATAGLYVTGYTKIMQGRRVKKLTFDFKKISIVDNSDE